MDRTRLAVGLQEARRLSQNNGGLVLKIEKTPNENLSLHGAPREYTVILFQPVYLVFLLYLIKPNIKPSEVGKETRIIAPLVDEVSFWHMN